MGFEKPPTPEDELPEKKGGSKLSDGLTSAEDIDFTGMKVPKEVNLGLDKLTSIEDINFRKSFLLGKEERGEELTSEEKSELQGIIEKENEK